MLGKKSGSASENDLLATLPEGYRPANDTYFPAIVCSSLAAANARALSAAADGEMRCASGGVSGFHIRFFLCGGVS
jgi:hypothetical protein